MNSEEQLNELCEFFSDEEFRLKTIIKKIKFILQTYSYYNKAYDQEEIVFEEIKEMLDSSMIDLNILLNMSHETPDKQSYKKRITKLHQKTIVSGFMYECPEERIISE